MRCKMRRNGSGTKSLNHHSKSVAKRVGCCSFVRHGYICMPWRNDVFSYSRRKHTISHIISNSSILKLNNNNNRKTHPYSRQMFFYRYSFCFVLFLSMGLLLYYFFFFFLFAVACEFVCTKWPVYARPYFFCFRFFFLFLLHNSFVLAMAAQQPSTQSQTQQTREPRWCWEEARCLFISLPQQPEAAPPPPDSNWIYVCYLNIVLVTFLRCLFYVIIPIRPRHSVEQLNQMWLMLGRHRYSFILT